MNTLNAVRRRPLPVLVGLIAGLVVALGALFATPNVYQSSAVISFSASPTVAAEDLFGSTNFVQQRASTYAALAASVAFAREISEQVPGVESPTITASAQQDTSLLTVNATGPTAELAQQVATAATNALIARADTLDIGPGGVRSIDLVVAEPAGLPAGAVQPVPWIYLASGLAFGAAVGVIVTRLRSRSDSLVSQPGDLVEITGDTSAVFSLPDRRWNGRGSGPRHAEYAERLASVHQEFVAMPGRDNRVLLIAAPTPQHAETAHQVADDLSNTLVRGGRRVVVLRLEGDEQREHRPGLSDVLAGSHGIQQVVFRDNSGRYDLGPGQQILRLLTATEREIRGVVGQLLSMADFVVVDAPPLSSPVGFPVMSQVADAVLITATLRDLRTAELTAARATVERLRVRLLGLLLAPREPLPADMPGRGAVPGSAARPPNGQRSEAPATAEIASVRAPENS